MQVINAFREYDVSAKVKSITQSSNPDVKNIAPYPPAEMLTHLEKCPICKMAKVDLNHFAAHNKQLLARVGLIKPAFKDHKSSRMTCLCCGYEDKNCAKVGLAIFRKETLL